MKWMGTILSGPDVTALVKEVALDLSRKLREIYMKGYC